MSTVQKTLSKTNVVDLVYCGMFATLMMIGANITSFAPFFVVGGVPITLQTFFAVLAGLVLGSRNGAIACTVYMLIGLAGAPVFAKFSGGFDSILSPTFGFIVTFILAAYLTGKIVETFQTLKHYIIAALLSMFVIYTAGTNWMYLSYKFWADAPPELSYQLIWGWMLVPLPKDIILAIFAAFLAFRLQKILKILPIKTTKLED
ncbi:biotin transporter BioY [Ureibacillus sinduriensis]|uniref:Biotin transporter n=1 Tax=Ureibacillus sinduriensis BLB-1 = JCM 15800 TaxID=1384057 RepID=A0A0A3HS28_9BACL|nr:biotin transporter BioY [Ureibacillus sinduriensis]KGR75204.1 biotin biosynthesis protein BioC [Ureibacillus sinduriensis BLB-1 = JCM 15800]